MLHLKGCFLFIFTLLKLSNGLDAAVCEDVSKDVCSAFASNISNMCGNSCLANLCKHFCGTCPLKCYECHEIELPQDCNTTVTCPTHDHYCAVTQSFTDDFKEVFKLGCALNSVCAMNFPETNLVIGKREESDELQRSGTHIDGGCCTEDLCNNKSPVDMEVVMVPGSTTSSSTTQTATVPHSSVCSDVDSAACTKLSSAMPNMCDTDCVATNICPRTCGKCFECFNCPHVSNIKDCNQTTTCQPGQDCYALETLSTTTFQHGYHLGCMDKHVCTKFYVEIPPVVGRRQSVEVSVQGVCCQSDLCNDQLVQTTTTPTTTTTTATTAGHGTTAPHPNYPTCQVHISKCPSGFTLDRHTRSCYKAVRSPKTWSEAKEYCRLHCAELPDFKSNSEMSYVAELLQIGAIPFSGQFIRNEAFYVDANSDGGSWQWSTTGQAIPTSLMGYSPNSQYHCGVFVVPAKYSHITSNYLFMAEVPCSNHHYFLCEIKNVNV